MQDQGKTIGGSKKRLKSCIFKAYDRLNQKSAKKAVIGMHVRYPGVLSGCHCDDVTGFKVKYAACGNRELVFPQRVHGWLGHSNDFVVHQDGNPHGFSPGAAPINLFVDVVTSRNGHNQFSVLVLHTTCKVAVRGLKSPVFNHCKD